MNLQIGSALKMIFEDGVVERQESSQPTLEVEIVRRIQGELEKKEDEKTDTVGKVMIYLSCLGVFGLAYMQIISYMGALD